MEELDKLIEEFKYKCYEKVVNDDLISKSERNIAKEYVQKKVELASTTYIKHSMFISINNKMSSDELYTCLILNYYRFGLTFKQQLCHYFKKDQLENIKDKIENDICFHSLYSKYQQRKDSNINLYSKDELAFIFSTGEFIQNNQKIYEQKLDFLHIPFKKFLDLFNRIKFFHLLYPNDDFVMNKIPSNICKTVLDHFKKNNIDFIELEKFLPFSKQLDQYYQKAKLVKTIYPDKKVLYKDLPKDSFGYILMHYQKENNLLDIDHLKEIFPMVMFPPSFEERINIHKYLFPGYKMTYENFKQSIDYTTIDYIIEHPVYDAIQEVLVKRDKDISYFKGIIHSYLLAKGYSKKEYDLKRKEVINCFDHYTNEKQEKLKQIKKQEIIERRKSLKETATLIIEDFIASNMTQKQYLKEQNMKDSLFYKYLDIVQEFDLDLYKKYIQNSYEIKKQSFSDLCEKGLLVTEKINSDIKLPTGMTRKFDILDFYEEGLYVTPDICKMVRTSKQIDASVKRNFRNFVEKNKILNPNSFFDKNQVLKEQVMIHVEFDKRGNIIEGSGHVVTEEEKLSIMDYLVNHHIPLNKVTYNAAFKRFKENTLFIEENKEKVHVKNFT